MTDRVYADEWETKVVNMTCYHVGGAPYPVPYNPSAEALGQQIADYAKQGWEVVSVDVRQDSGWILRADDSRTIVVFKRRKQK